MSKVFSYLLPMMCILFIAVGVFKKVNVFDAFIKGAKNGLGSAVRVFPSVLALIFAVKLLRESGVIDVISYGVAPFLEMVGLPKEVLPMALLRPISGSGSSALLVDTFETYGPDSYIGMLASVICCSSETTFYTVAVYFGSINIKKSRHTITAAICADIAAVIFSILFVNLTF